MAAAGQLSRDQVKEYLKNLSLLEAAALVKELEQELGVSAAAPVAMAAPAAGGGAAAAPAPEQDEFTVMLTGSGDKKIQVIKVVRELTGLGLKEAKDLVDGAPKPVKEGVSKAEAADVKSLKEAKDLVDGAPKPVKEGVSKAEAADVKKKIEDAGGSVELK